MVLPFADIVLLASSTGLAMIFSSLLSIFILGETFICKYDLTAMVLIAVGCTLLVLQSHIQHVDLNYAKVKELLISKKAVAHFVFTICIFTATFIAYKL